MTITNLSRTATTVCILTLLATVLPATANVWNPRAPMLDPRYAAAVETINGILYVAGGTDQTGYETATLQAYDVAGGKWSLLASMPAGRYSGDGAGVINSRLYVPGGWTVEGRLPTNTLFMYDPTTNTWSTKAPMLRLSGCGATGVIDSKLYVATSCDGYSHFTPFLDVYDPLTNTWTNLANSTFQHIGPAYGVINGKFYLAGGGPGVSNYTEVYDPATNRWTTLAPMPIALTLPASVVLNGLLWVFGGQDAQGNILDTVLAYDPHRDLWLDLTPLMPTARTGAGAAAVYGMGFVEGGNSGGGNNGVLPTNEAFTAIPFVP